MISPSSSNKSKEIAPYMCSYCARKFFRIASYKIHENKCKVLYGGSVNPKNINDLKSIVNIDGYLIGGASQDPKKFIDIIKKTYN